MSITESTIVEDRVQADGRRAVRERHTDHRGLVECVDYLAEPDADASATMAARVAQIESRQAASEIERNIANILAGDYVAVTSHYATLADIRAALRLFYQVATNTQVGRMAGFLLTLTDAQLRNIFNKTQAEVDQLKVRLANRVSELNAVLGAAGE